MSSRHPPSVRLDVESLRAFRAVVDEQGLTPAAAVPAELHRALSTNRVPL